jgi:hypothetical protein
MPALSSLISGFFDEVKSCLKRLGLCLSCLEGESTANELCVLHRCQYHEHVVTMEPTSLSTGDGIDAGVLKRKLSMGRFCVTWKVAIVIPCFWRVYYKIDWFESVY